MEGSVGNLWIEFGVAGYEEIAQAVNQLHLGLGALASQATGMGAQLQGVASGAQGIADAGASLGDFASRIAALGTQTGALSDALGVLDTSGNSKLAAGLVSMAGDAATVGEKLKLVAQQAARLNAQPAAQRSAADLAALQAQSSGLSASLVALSAQLAALGQAQAGPLGAQLAAAAQQAQQLGKQAQAAAPVVARPLMPPTLGAASAPGKTQLAPRKMTQIAAPKEMAQEVNAKPLAANDPAQGMRAMSANIAQGGKSVEATAGAGKTALEGWAQSLGKLVAAFAGAPIGGATAGMAQGVAKLTEGVAGLGRAILPATAGLYGWAAAGVMASGSGQVLGYQFQELGRQIASLFAPQVKWLISQGQELITWFQRLNGAQQAGLRNWLLLAGGISAVGIALPIVVSSVGAAIKAFQAFQVALTAVRASVIALNMAWVASPIGLIVTGIALAIGAIILATSSWEDAMSGMSTIGREIAQPFNDIIVALREIVSLTKEWTGAAEDGKSKGLFSTIAENISRRNRLGEMAFGVTRPDGSKPESTAGKIMGGLGQYANYMSPISGAVVSIMDLLGIKPPKRKDDEKGREELAPRLGGFEEIDQTYKRIAEASLKATGVQEKTVQEKTNDLLEKLVAGMPTITDAASRVRPVNTR